MCRGIKYVVEDFNDVLGENFNIALSKFRMYISLQMCQFHITEQILANNFLVLTLLYEY